MDWKEFLKPTVRKVVLTMLLFYIISSYFSTGYISLFLEGICDPCGCYGEWGAPLHVREVTAIDASITEHSFSCGTRVDKFNGMFLIADLALWYPISSLAISSYNKFRN
ncbi:Uncharacterised protein [uncultured archaeon]|nr:Uncharacterised protein [uncultured archaeon]